MHKERILSFALAVVLLLASCGRGRESAKPTLDKADREWLALHQEALYFAPDPFYAPFEFLDAKDGMTKGLAHDYLNLIEEKLGIGFKEVKASSFDEILSLARQRKVAVVNAVTETAERDRFLLFTKPFIEIKNVIVTRKGQVGITSLASLEGRRVAVVKGYAVTEYLRTSNPKLILDVVPTDLGALLNVAYRISDAAVLDLATASYIASREGLADIQVSGDTGYPIRLAIGTRSDWPELNAILGKALDTITSDERRAIEGKWIGLLDRRFAISREILIGLAALFLLVLAALFVGVLWHVNLKRQVVLRTRELRRTIAQKDRLLLELYHRTKNNMQVILSMIQLKAGESGGEESARITDWLRIRIHAMALVQQKLYESQDLSSIDLRTYIAELAGMLTKSHRVDPARIAFVFEVQPVAVLFDIATPCGLILTELISNSIQHGFPDGRSGEIKIGLERNEDSHEIVITLTDDGVGTPPGFSRESCADSGLGTVCFIVEHQLGGTISFGTGPGFACRVSFGDDAYAKRIEA